mmetsp:Transcript_56075/g.179950  ORF Transcript_56075/g.179950 Transcript_56075/m.179950 type:complete len:539 (-) Transcript_56075:217-1833(-)
MIPPTDAVLNRISQEFPYEDLAAATRGFSAAARLGEGTYGTVFSGLLRDGTEVAIKALASPKEGGFREEVEVLSRFRHPNLVILMGFARKGRERYLVYELLPGGDVNSRLNKDPGFTWKQRLSVVHDAALGLSHLHGSRPQVFHRDVKTQNILMDRNGTGKVADFGLACLAQPNQDRLAVSQTSGTIGYADPLYIRTGVVTEKSEVYSMGMVLLEVLTGRPPALQHPSGRIEYQFDHLNGDLRKLLPMVDRRGKWPESLAQRVGGLALQCTCEHEAYRPSFVDIVKQLRAWLRDEQFQQHEPQQAIPAQPLAPVELAGHSGAGRFPPVQAPQVAQAAQASTAEGGSSAATYVQAQKQAPWPQAEAAAAHWASNPGRAAAAKQSNPFAEGQPGLVHQAAAAAASVAAAVAAAAAAQSNPFADSAAPAVHQRAGQQEQRPGSVAGRPVAMQHAAAVQPPALGWQAAEGSARDYGEPRRASAGPQSAERAAGPERQPRSQSGQEEMVAQLTDMGYTRQQALEACKRCSTVEAAVEWILTHE